MKNLSCRFYINLGLFSILTVKGCSETVFLKSALTKSYTVCNFRNKVAMTIVLISKCLKFNVDSGYGTKEWIKVFGFKDNCIWIGTSKSHNREQDTCHWQSICYETPLRFTMSLKDIFCKSGSVRVMEKYYGSTLMQILYKFGTL